MIFAILFLFETLVRPMAMASVPQEDPNTHVVKAKIFDQKDPARLLFTFERTPVVRGQSLKVTRAFKDVSGKPAAVEEIFYDKGKLTKLNIDQKQLNEKGGFEIKGDKLVFNYTKNGETKTDEEKLEEPLIVADTVAAFIHEHWDELMKGESLKVRMPVPARLETIGFKFEKDADSTYEGKPVHTIKMMASSFIVRMAINPLVFSIDKGENKSVLRVVGRIVPKIQKDGKWSDTDAVSIFSHEAATSKTK